MNSLEVAIYETGRKRRTKRVPAFVRSICAPDYSSLTAWARTFLARYSYCGLQEADGTQIYLRDDDDALTYPTIRDFK